MLSHIPLNLRAKIYLQLVDFLVFELAPNRRPAQRATNSKRSKDVDISINLLAIRHKIKNAIEDAEENYEMSLPISELLRQVLHSLEDHVAVASNSTDVFRRDQVNLVCKYLNNVDCHRCAANFDTLPCRGDLDHDSVLVGNGECFTWITGIFEYLLEASDKKINRLHVKACAERNVFFGTSSSLSLAYGVRAVTRYQSAQDTFDVGIEVIIPKDSAVSDLLAIPYVFAHEIICHAYQKAGLGKDVLCERGDDCPFTEGWMDELAFNSLCELLQKYRNNAPALIRAMPSKIYEQSQKVFDSRYYVERDRRAFSRATGRDALRSVEQLLWIWHDHPYFSRYATTPDLIVNEVLFEFSFLLNILADDNQAEDVVFYTSSILPFSESVPNFHSRNLDYLKALISFLDQQNLNLFLLDLNKQFRSL